MSTEYPTYLGYGSDEHSKIYGLWEPVLDRFLFVGHKSETLQRVAFLSSSRYLLFPVCLNTALNYQHNLIDNKVCENWTLENRGDVSTLPMNYAVTDAQMLLETHTMANWDLTQEKKWLTLIWHYVFFLDMFREKLLWNFQNTMIRKVSTAMGHFPDQVEKFENKVYEIIYMGRDIELVKKQVEELIDSQPLVKKYWLRYVQQ